MSSGAKQYSFFRYNFRSWFFLYGDLKEHVGTIGPCNTSSLYYRKQTCTLNSILACKFWRNYMDVTHVFLNSQVLYQNQTECIKDMKKICLGWVHDVFVWLALYGNSSVIIQCWIKNPKGQLLEFPCPNWLGILWAAIPFYSWREPVWLIW